MCNGIFWMRLKKNSLFALGGFLCLRFGNLCLCIMFLFLDSIKQDVSRGHAGEEQSLSNVNVMCRLCFFGENEGSEKARRMLPCKKCGKKYHRSCLKSWAQHRGKI